MQHIKSVTLMQNSKTKCFYGYVTIDDARGILEKPVFTQMVSFIGQFECEKFCQHIDFQYCNKVLNICPLQFWYYKLKCISN